MNAGQGEKFAMSRRGFVIAGSALIAAACTTDVPDSGAADDTELRSAIRGRVLLPGDAGFDEARMPWNRTIDQSVSAVAELADADDAAALVRYVRQTGGALAVQPNGHNPTHALDGTILVRTNQLNEIRIDPAARTARVGAGVTWGQVQAAASPHGLTGVAGSSPAVGVTGYTLGGGISWFGRAFGWAADSVTAFDIVDAEGRPRRVTAASEPDLFWALRGGGGDYALVTALEFELHPAPTLFGGKMLWPAERAPQVMATFREITATAPDELALWWSLVQFGGAPPMVGVDTTFLGPEPTGRALLQPFDRIDGRITDTRAIMPIADLGTITREPTEPSPIHHHVELLHTLSDADVEALLTTAMEPVVAIQIRHLGGALARTSDSAAGTVGQPYYIGFISVQTTPESAAANQTRIQGYLDAMAQSRSGRTPFSLLMSGQSAKDAFDPGTLARLRDIKRRVDPKDVFRSNFPVLEEAGR